MLTANGEVKVLDFGLARWLDQPAAAAAPAPVLHTVPEGEDDEFGWAFLDADATDSGRKTAILDHGVEHTQNLAQTAVGITLGTPLYMSPEQARGEHLTPASDMFSFGLLLQTLFTGHEPYPMDILGSEIMRRAARGDTLPMTGDHSITALVNRLKQLAPTDRITAHETVTRLQYIADAPRRIWRRAIAAAVILIVVAAAWKYTIDLRRERAAAIAAQHEAEHRRAQADDLIGFMLGDLRTKLEPLTRLDLLDGAATHALTYLSDLDPRSMNTAELVRAAKALNQLGEVRIGQGSLAAAATAFNKALAFASAAVQRDPHDVDAQLMLGTTHFWMGEVRRRNGEYAHALPEIEIYRRTAESLSRAHPADAHLRREWGLGEMDVGAVLEAKGDLRGALTHYETAIGIQQTNADRQPNNTEMQSELARLNNHIGFIRQKLGQLDEARRRFENEVSIYDHILAEQPSQNVWRQRLANAHSFLAGVLEDLGSEAAAMEQRRIELSLDEELGRIDPTNADWRRNLAIANIKMAFLLRDRDRAAAIAAADRAESEMKAVLEKDPTRSDWVRDLAGVDWSAARIHLAAGDIATARKLAEKSLEVYRRSATSASGNIRLADVLITTGDIAVASRDSAGAHRAWNEAAAIVQPIAAHSSDPPVMLAWMRVLTRLGRDADAQPLADRLAAMHYGNPEIMSLTRKRIGS
jgi:tetratricopeptide (TPR) repeat protein